LRVKERKVPFDIKLAQGQAHIKFISRNIYEKKQIKRRISEWPGTRARYIHACTWSYTTH